MHWTKTANLNQMKTFRLIPAIAVVLLLADSCKNDTPATT
jgi:hypothetical protein